MQVEDQQLKIFLAESELLSEKDLEVVSREAKKSNKRLDEVIIEKGLATEEEVNNFKAYILGIPFIDLEENEIEESVLKIIPEQVARQYNAVAFSKEGNQLKIAMLNPGDLQFIDFISKKTSLKVIPCLTNKKGLKKALKSFQKSLKAEFGDIGIEDIAGEKKLIVKAEKEEGKKDIDLKKAAEDLPVVKIVDTFLKHAILQGASKKMS